MIRRINIYPLLVCVILVLGCSREKPSGSVASQTQEVEYPDQEGWNSSVTSSKSGRVEAIVEYGHMMRYAKKNRVFFDEGVKVDFYDALGRKRTELTADAG
ncbi:hypothetical protein JXO59_01345, partial [candidate division KSB1 bacterium]|nr:hypothetical protein [candidate division KSB1 bacterium]